MLAFVEENFHLEWTKKRGAAHGGFNSNYGRWNGGFGGYNGGFGGFGNFGGYNGNGNYRRY